MSSVSTPAPCHVPYGCGPPPHPFPRDTPLSRWSAGPHSAPHKGVSCSQWDCVPAKIWRWGKNSEVGEAGVGGCPLCFFSALCLFLWHPWIFSCYWSVLLPGFQNPLRSMPRWQGLLVITSRVPCVDFSAPECILLQYDILQPEAPVTPLERSKPSLRLEFPAL